MADLPSSPSARAFFAALDAQGDNQGKSHQKKRQPSDFVQKRIQTLGWRNRHSQDEYYPVSLTIAKDDDEERERVVEFSVRQVQRGELENTYGTGATVWPAAMVLCKYMEKHAKELVNNKTIVDLGSGTGVTSIAAAFLGSRHVVCTDGEPNVVRLARDNVAQVMEGQATSEQPRLNNGADEAEKKNKSASVDEPESCSSFVLNDCRVEVEQYWWGSRSLGVDTDVVLVADCVLPKLYPIGPLVEALDQLLTKASAVAILSYEHRFYPEFDPRDKFRELAVAKGLVVDLVPIEEQHAIFSVEDIEVWLVRRRE